jgi:hypothetical protein
VIVVIVLTVMSPLATSEPPKYSTATSDALAAALRPPIKTPRALAACLDSADVASAIDTNLAVSALSRANDRTYAIKNKNKNKQADIR